MMQYLEHISKTPYAVWYRVQGDYAGAIQRYVVTTPDSRRICNEPELVGWQFTDAMRHAVTGALATAPFAGAIQSVPQHRVCVLNFLRGGLNFDLRTALHDAYGMNHHVSAFMSSQRRRTEGRWEVHEDMYRKLRIPDGAILMVGDVVATGATISNGLSVLLSHMTQLGSRLSMLVFFAVGCHKLEKHLEAFHERCLELFPNYEATHAVYLEGKFKLVDSKTHLRISIQGTDLIKPGALLAPEYALTQYGSLNYPLERCVIYDAGSRAFDVPHYLDDVAGYWTELRNLARRGWTMADALQERWPDRQDDQVEQEHRTWRGIDEDLFVRIQQARENRWTEAFQKTGATARALERLCDERLGTIEGLTSL